MTIKNISLVSNCTGCSACFEVCPKKAIQMIPNEEGFLYPQVDNNECINCGLCLKSCPSENPVFLNNEKPKCMVAASKKDRKQSSSGGIFPLLAEKILQNNGFVCGAAWSKEIKLKHIIISSIQDLPKLQKSKYVQSDITGIYPKIKMLLENNKTVLFSGTPCQVAGLNSFLSKTYENLYTVDIICHGVPSPKVLKQYLREIQIPTSETIKDINFRDKKYGWSYKLNTKITTDKADYDFSSQTDIYMQAFLKNLSLRKSCGECPFAQLPRQGDITLGDFWGIWNYEQSLDDKQGTSIILINSNKGNELLKSIEGELLFNKQMPLDIGIKGNKCIVEPTKLNKYRDNFFTNLPNMSLQENLDICLGKKYDCGILNFWHTNNYGALLTCYALQTIIKRQKKTVRVINYLPDFWKGRFNGNISEDFSQKYLDLTNLYTTSGELKKLNEQTKTFICGSDQIWRYRYIRNNGKDVYALSFANASAKKIAYAASFGTNIFEGNDEETLNFKYNLQRFNYISVREQNGVDICKKIFNVQATHVLDPVFLLEQKDWDELSQNANNKDKNDLVSYLINKDDISAQIISFAEQKLQTKIFNFDDAYTNKKQHLSVEDFLYKIKNCKFFITDSFHGLCFAIIFNKPFVCIINKERGESRFTSLANLLQIEDRMISSVSELENLSFQCDFKKINSILKQQKDFSIQWLINALNDDSTTLSPQNFVEMADTLFKLIKYQAQQPKEDNNIQLLQNIANYSSNRLNYYRCKLLSKITFGKMRKHYKNKRKDLKLKIKQVKQFLKRK